MTFESRPSGCSSRGRAIVGRYAAGVARDKIATARICACEKLMPLWIGVEVC